MVDIGIDASGFAELAVRLAATTARRHKVMRQELEHVAYECKQAMREEAPVGAVRPGRDYGKHPHLRDTITYTLTGDGATGLTATIGPQVPHSHLVEFGTVRNAPNPFAARAAARIQPLLPEAGRKVVEAL